MMKRNSARISPIIPRIHAKKPSTSRRILALSKKSQTPLSLSRQLSPPREPSAVYPVKAGDLCIVTTGEYSDYRILGVYRALKPFDKDTLRAAFVEAFAREGQEAFLDPRTELVMDASYFSDEAFVRWMLTEGYIAIMDAYTVHLHGYSTENFSIGIAPCGEDA
jgi:hypothetical protein